MGARRRAGARARRPPPCSAATPSPARRAPLCARARARARLATVSSDSVGGMERRRQRRAAAARRWCEPLMLRARRAAVLPRACCTTPTDRARYSSTGSSVLPPRCEKTCKKSLENANKVCMVPKKFACGAHFFRLRRAVRRHRAQNSELGLWPLLVQFVWGRKKLRSSAHRSPTNNR